MNYDLFIATLCLWREAQNCSQEAINGIWHVLINRVQDTKNRWPKSIHQCVLQPKQFSSFNPNDVNVGKFPNIANQLEWAAFKKCLNVVANSIGPDPTNGATNYENCEQGHLPSWADPAKETAVIAPFRFYKL